MCVCVCVCVRVCVCVCVCEVRGLGTCNEAGERLLELCAINNLTIMNTWFKKKPVHLGTWVHPATKQAHMIDFVYTGVLVVGRTIIW